MMREEENQRREGKKKDKRKLKRRDEQIKKEITGAKQIKNEGTRKIVQGH